MIQRVIDLTEPILEYRILSTCSGVLYGLPVGLLTYRPELGVKG